MTDMTELKLWVREIVYYPMKKVINGTDARSLEYIKTYKYLTSSRKKTNFSFYH